MGGQAQRGPLGTMVQQHQRFPAICLYKAGQGANQLFLLLTGPFRPAAKGGYAASGQQGRPFRIGNRNALARNDRQRNRQGQLARAFQPKSGQRGPV